MLARCFRYLKDVFSSTIKPGAWFSIVAIISLNACAETDGATFPLAESGTVAEFARGYAEEINGNKGQSFQTYTLLKAYSSGKDVISELRVDDPAFKQDLLTDQVGVTEISVTKLRERLCSWREFEEAFSGGLRVIDNFRDERGKMLMQVVVDRC